MTVATTNIDLTADDRNRTHSPKPIIPLGFYLMVIFHNIAEDMSEWFTEGACDGFMIAATHIPGAYEDFVQMVVPQLQNMGIVQSEYTTTTMRENLGLPKPLR